MINQPPAKPREFWIKPAEFTDEEDLIFHEYGSGPDGLVHVIEKSYADRMEQELAFVKTQWKQTSDLLEQERNRLTAELAEMRKERDEALSACDAARGTIEALNRELLLNTGTGNQLLKVIDAWMAQAAALAGALEKIESMKDMTRLADCCVEKSCHINAESGSCSFQTGVHYGNSDRAGDATEALAAYREFLKGRD